MEEIQIPERMFATCEEPAGERVNTYHKPKRIDSIIEALEPDEVEFMRNTTFGKIISQAENPSFSGTFGQFVIVRMLKVKKKYEIWFLFAGKPIRMSLQEFAHVTGLNCNKIIKKNIKRKKNPITEKLYWGELFGSLKFCPVDAAIEMLKRRSEFLAYPWGRVTFEMLAEPAVVIESDSESDSGCNDIEVELEEDTEAPAPQPKTVRYYVNPTHVRDLDEETKTEVISMIEDTTHSRNQLEWDDEIDDETVDNLVRLIQNGKVVFNKAMFVGGLTGVDLSRMRAEKKQKEKEGKDKKEPESQPDVLATDAVDIGSSSRIANLVAGLINKKIADALSIKDAKIEQSLAKVIIAQREKMEGEVIWSIIGFLGKQMPTSVREEDTSGRGQSGGENVDAANSAGPVLSPEDHGNQLGVAGSPLTRKEPLPHAEYNDSQSQADEVINKVINDVQEFANPYDLTATENSHTSLWAQLQFTKAWNMLFLRKWKDLKAPP
ncbi:PREDICTED: uncharacterized protein LOC106329989 [Brassica oleracea var. oleracea]|uniref:uncharacterized protein LOC106329989 n=1 Tax=Brassica oleracea var. oleracea TaxID=109376 RepID=UPI0006A752BE|nr:PREDICTED: uncharacterized protein LOC106329989 [Brassica oleracea var. oleracea]